MTSIYDQHSTTFNNVSAFVVVKDGVRVATIAFKFGTRLHCFAHVFGAVMVRAYAGGGGYDRMSAAVEGCFDKMKTEDHGAVSEGYTTGIHCAALKAALAVNSGYGWERRIEDAGYSVFQAV